MYNRGLLTIFFFFKQKTAYEMRISDWSSDVCSSDLDRREGADQRIAHRLLRIGEAHQPEHRVRRDRKEARLDEGDEREPIFGVRMRRFLHGPAVEALDHGLVAGGGGQDRKSTRLNSSH